MNHKRLFLQTLLVPLFSLLAVPPSEAQNEAALRVVLKGYDPVAYFTEGRPVKGSPQFKVDWDGERYLFSSAGNRDKFAAAPERFAPQFGGYCTGSMAKGVRNEADPEAWLISEGKLYLFEQVKFRDIAQNDHRWLVERVALADEKWRARR